MEEVRTPFVAVETSNLKREHRVRDELLDFESSTARRGNGLCSLLDRPLCTEVRPLCQEMRRRDELHWTSRVEISP